MNLTILSDLHLEFHRDGGNSVFDELYHSTEKSVLVLAGDLCSLSFLAKNLAEICRMYKNVVYVCGNHELYGHCPEEVDGVRKTVCGQLKNLHWLEDSTAEIDGQRFIGGTLWFPDPGDVPEKWGLNDYHQIREFEPWVYEKHRKSVDFLRDELKESDVLVTHHMPFSRSISKEYARSKLNAFFYSGREVEELVSTRSPKMAIHGHTHFPSQYKVGTTHVICNPFGYPGENQYPEAKTVWV